MENSESGTYSTEEGDAAAAAVVVCCWPSLLLEARTSRCCCCCCCRLRTTCLCCRGEVGGCLRVVLACVARGVVARQQKSQRGWIRTIEHQHRPKQGLCRWISRTERRCGAKQILLLSCPSWKQHHAPAACDACCGERLNSGGALCDAHRLRSGPHHGLHFCVDCCGGDAVLVCCVLLVDGEGWCGVFVVVESYELSAISQAGVLLQVAV